ncbi:hypothetical protein ROZALSC1DRAFT_31226, partial [Rozella allomycis CSF55]
MEFKFNFITLLLLVLVFNQHYLDAKYMQRIRNSIPFTRSKTSPANASNEPIRDRATRDIMDPTEPKKKSKLKRYAIGGLVATGIVVGTALTANHYLRPHGRVSSFSAKKTDDDKKSSGASKGSGRSRGK